MLARTTKGRTVTGLVVTIAGRLYDVRRPWGTLPDGQRLNDPSHVAVDSEGNVYAFQRASPPIVVFGPDGNFLRSWGEGLIDDPHGIFITRDDDVWLIDRDAHEIIRFDSMGNPMLRLGERHHPRLQQPFNHPSDIAVALDGSIFVADGYGNSCVHRFAPDGTHVRTWGSPGNGPGEFTTPHAAWVDQKGQVLVADRENNRVQVFTPDGDYVTEWGDFYHPMDIYQDASGLIYVTDQIPRLSVLNPDGSLVGRCRPVLNGAHGIWGDARGNLYLSELGPHHRITRLSPKDS
jgi:DNA-binding beta-propeller fold protein YncE